jgi:thiol:disulfide interchange protein DsbA
MQRWPLALVVSALLTLGACGKTRSTDDQSRGAGTPAAALSPPVTQAPPQATAVERQEAGLAPTPAAKKAHLNEDGSETVDETAVDSGAHNSLLTAVAATVAAATPSAAAAVPSGPTVWQEGVNYTRLVPAQPTSVPPGQVEVLKFFWYGCPHCFALDPQVETWKKAKPSYVTFTRVPVMWNDVHRATARLFYTLSYMGKIDQFHGDVFKEIHVNGNPLVAADPTDAAADERLQTTFIERLGISADDFKKTYDSFQVETALQRADQLMRRYRIDGVPTFVVNGKYIADVRSAQSPERLIALIDDLSMQEHKR